MPPSSHVIYIPVILLLGIVLGFIWGAKVTKEAYMIAQKNAEERVRKRAERAAAAEKAASAAKTSSETPPPG